MTNPTIVLNEYISNNGVEGDVDFLRQSIEILSYMLMELEWSSKYEQGNTNPKRSEAITEMVIAHEPGRHELERLNWRFPPPDFLSESKTEGFSPA